MPLYHNYTADIVAGDAAVAFTANLAYDQSNAAIIAMGGHSPTSRGYIAWTAATPHTVGGTVLATAGTLYLHRIRQVPASSITNIIIFLTFQGATLTADQCFISLFESDGTLIGQSADQSVEWATTGVKTAPLSGGPFAFAGGDLYVGMWFNGTTGPTVLRVASVSTSLANAGVPVPNAECATADTGLTTTAPNPFGAQTANAFEFWAALS